MVQTSAGTVSRRQRFTARHRAHLVHEWLIFSGWEMPVEYSGLDKRTSRRSVETAGLFDVSHMGEIEVAGDDALAAIQHALHE